MHRLLEFFLLLIFCLDHVWSSQSLEDLSRNQIVFSCDFDSNTNCGGVTESDYQDFEIQVVQRSGVIVDESSNYTITDVSSITKSTISNNNCAIPFSIGNTEFYHCTSSYECAINESNELDTCREGYFASAKIEDAYEKQSTTLTFPDIQIDEDGEYKLEYYAFMYCDRVSQVDCQNQTTPSDVITVLWRNYQQAKTRFDIGSQKFELKQLRWTRMQSPTINLKKGYVEIQIEFIRQLELQTLKLQFGIDDLKLYKLNQDTSSTQYSTATVSSDSPSYTVSSTGEPSSQTSLSTNQTTTKPPVTIENSDLLIFILLCTLIPLGTSIVIVLLLWSLRPPKKPQCISHHHNQHHHHHPCHQPVKEEPHVSIQFRCKN